MKIQNISQEHRSISKVSAQRKAVTGRSRSQRVSVQKDVFQFSAKGIFTSFAFDADKVNQLYGDVKITGSFSGKKTKGCGDGEFEKIDFDKIHQVKLPEKMADRDCGYVYYHGQRVSQNELVQIAVSEGKMTMEEVEENGTSAYRKAFDVLITDEAKAKYAWSNTKYSEDGKYTFQTRADGSTTWHLVQDEEMGASLEEIAGWICSGMPCRNIEKRYVDYLRVLDSDLLKTAQEIGKHVQTFDLLSSQYENGRMGDAQHEYDMQLLALLFHRNTQDDFFSELMKAKKTYDFDALLQAYDPLAAEQVNAIRHEQDLKTGGIM